jgi:tRNA(Ile)-lysidine synthetase-like protein
MKTNKEVANFFWHGNPMSKYELGCISSFIKNNWIVRVWAFSNITVPDGAEVCDANLFYKEEDIQTFVQKKKVGCLAAFSDAFRYKVLKHSEGWWFDTDCICLKDQSEFKPILIHEEDEDIQVGNRMLHIYVEEKTPDFKVPTDPNIACLDADSLNFPLEIRKAQEGDWFCPLGMNSKKLISDFLTDKKVPVNLKKTTNLLLSKGSVAWIVGQRIDNRFKVSDKTETVMILEIK